MLTIIKDYIFIICVELQEIKMYSLERMII